MSIFDLLPQDGHCITLDRCVWGPPPKMSKECALEIIAAEKLYGKGTMRPELLAEAKTLVKEFRK